MITRKKIIIIIGVIFLVGIIASLAYWLVGKPVVEQPIDLIKSQDQDAVNLPEGNLTPNEQGQSANQANKPLKPVTNEDRDKTELKNTAKFFVEMLGSYSPDAKFQNVIDLQPLMTDKMQLWADDFMVRNLPKINEQDEKLTTQVFKVDIINYGGGQARLQLETRRQKKSSQDNKFYSQQVEVDLVKVGGKWLVDEVNWQ